MCRQLRVTAIHPLIYEWLGHDLPIMAFESPVIIKSFTEFDDTAYLQVAAAIHIQYHTAVII